MNDTTRQVGGALGVAIIGSVLASLYRPHVTTNLAHTASARSPRVRPFAGQAQTAVNAIRDQLGAVYAVADKVPGGAGGPAGQELIRAARHAFVDGFGGAVLVGCDRRCSSARWLCSSSSPAHASDAPEDDPNVRFAQVVDGELQTNQPLTDMAGTDGEPGLVDDSAPEPSIPAAAIGVVDTALVGVESTDAEAVP